MRVVQLQHAFEERFRAKNDFLLIKRKKVRALISTDLKLG